jgi:hypothetical protein
MTIDVAVLQCSKLLSPVMKSADDTSKAYLTGHSVRVTRRIIIKAGHFLRKSRTFNKKAGHFKNKFF